MIHHIYCKFAHSLKYHEASKTLSVAIIT